MGDREWSMRMLRNIYEKARDRVLALYRQYTMNGGDPRQVMEAIDSAIGGITSVRFNAGKRFTVSSPSFAVSLPYSSSRRDRGVFALAYAGYLRAQQNGSRQPGEVHISRSMSTKHHRAGLETLLR